jgi:hypothetical protein
MGGSNVDTEKPAGGDGGDVAERDPDSIQREIEQTRAELADTIDAIADRISPRRAASRGAQAVRQQVSSVLGGHNGHRNGQAPASVLDASPDAAGGHTGAAPRAEAVRSIASSGGGTAYTGTRSYAVKRSLRADRALLAVGALAAVAGAIILWRSRD